MKLTAEHATLPRRALTLVAVLKRAEEFLDRQWQFGE
jgi:hypothetical protein